MSIVLIFFGLGAAAAVCFGLAGWRHYVAGQDGREEWALLTARGDGRVSGLSEADFLAVYRHNYGGRGSFLLGLGLVTCLVVTPMIAVILQPVLGFLLADVSQLEVKVGTRTVELTGRDLYGFVFALSLPLIWSAISFVFLLRYHRGMQYGFDDQLIAARLKRAKADGAGTSPAPGEPGC